MINPVEAEQLEKIAANYHKSYEEVKLLYDSYIDLGMENPCHTYKEIMNDSIERLNQHYISERNK